MSLVQKLGYQPGQKVYLEGAPKSILVELDYTGIAITNQLPADWVHIFVAHEANLRPLLALLEFSKVANGLWVSWPKKVSGVTTDLTEDTLRDILLPLGWVDVKVCTIDDIWSGLKFVRRKEEL